MNKRNRGHEHVVLKSLRIGFLLLVFLMAGCAKPTTPMATTEVQPTPSENQAPTDIDPITPTEPITEVQTEEPADSNCISCHVDKDQLINTADPVEEKESESSGEG